MIIDIHDTIINDIKLKKYEYDHIGIKDFCYVEKGETNNYLVLVHGHDSNADQIYTREDVFNAWYPIIKQYGFGMINFNTQGNGWMNKKVVWAMEKCIKFLKKEYNINKAIFAGGSMGGTSTMIYTLYHPEDVDGLICNCPASNMTEYYKFLQTQDLPILQEIRETIYERYEGEPVEGNMCLCNGVDHPEVFTMPFFLTHGNADELIPFKWSEELINKLKDKPNFNYKVIENGNHDSPIEAFEEEIAWIANKLNISKL